MKNKNLPKELAKLCNQLAHEQVKPIAWEMAAKLRREIAERITEGASTAALVGDLQQRLHAAVVAGLLHGLRRG